MGKGPKPKARGKGYDFMADNLHNKVMRRAERSTTRSREVISTQNLKKIQAPTVRWYYEPEPASWIYPLERAELVSAKVTPARSNRQGHPRGQKFIDIIAVVFPKKRASVSLINVSMFAAGMPSKETRTQEDGSYILKRRVSFKWARSHGSRHPVTMYLDIETGSFVFLRKEAQLDLMFMYPNAMGIMSFFSASYLRKQANE